MKLHPVVTHINGVVTVTLETSFIGDADDATDKQRILAYGDPKVNMSGTFTDSGDPAFSFSFSTPELYRGVTTQMSSTSARFLVSPDGPSTPLDTITPDPVRAAGVWVSGMASRITQAMTTLRAKTPTQLQTLPDSTI